MAEHVARVHQIIGAASALCASNPFRKSLQAAFLDRLASGSNSTPWFMLPILVCEALGGEIEPAYYAAAGIEMGRIAAGCLDEWQDHDTADALWQVLGPERTVSLATGMIALSLLSLNRMVDLGTRPAMVVELQREFEMTLLHMSEGQFADLSDNLSLDDYETVAGAKSGALFRLACRAGAMVAGAPADIVDCYGAFGHSLGLLVQVWNDIGGLSGLLGKNDAEQKRGLPVLAALSVDEDSEPMDYQPQSAEGQAGQLYTVLQLGLVHQQASEALARCPEVGQLQAFLDQYRPERLIEMLERVHHDDRDDAQPAVR